MKKIFVSSFLLIAVTMLYAQKFEQLNKLVATDRAVENNLGTSVAISGNYAVAAGSEIPSIGASSNCNCVYVFEKNLTGEWKQLQKLITTDASSPNRFGYSVSISGNNIIIGAPGDENYAGAAYIFQRSTNGSWIKVKKL